MHTSIVALMLVWLGNLPLSSAAPAPANTTLHAHRDLRFSDDLRANIVEIVDYPVPSTSSMIHFVLGPLLPPAVISNTMLSAHNHITSTIASEGDCGLPKSNDPFMYNKDSSAFIEAHSAEDSI